MEITVTQVLQKGTEAHKANKVRPYNQYYTDILTAYFKHSKVRIRR